MIHRRALILGLVLMPAVCEASDALWQELDSAQTDSKPNILLLLSDDHSYPYLSADTRRFALIDARGEHAIKSVEGDDPAADVTFR